jgi:uncharacterized protein YjbI with pentapeptide repeats
LAAVLTAVDAASWCGCGLTFRRGALRDYLMASDPRANAELEKVQAEAAKLRAEAEAHAENAKKIRTDLAHAAEMRALEWIKGLGAGAAVLLGVAAILTFATTSCNAWQQRRDDAVKRRDTEFASAAKGISAVDTSARLSAVVSLSRFVRPGYEEYAPRALPALVARLRFEPDLGIRRLILHIATERGDTGRAALLELRQDARLELLDLQQAGSVDSGGRRAILQRAFFDASRGVAGMVRQPLDLSQGPLDGFAPVDRNLAGANLSETSFRSADLAGVDLMGASLRSAVLRLAVLRNAKLKGADFEKTDLTCADLAGADLTNPRNLVSEQFAYTNWREAVLDEPQRRAMDVRYPAPDGSASERARLCRNVVH